MIRHMVLVKAKPAVEDRAMSDIMADLSALVKTLPGAEWGIGGKSDSPERIERGYTHAFTIDFDDWKALADYSANPDHQAIGARLLTIVEGAREGILVMDIES
ncbi:MAG: Dabb family protein [Pseudomonadota bacterium]